MNRGDAPPADTRLGPWLFTVARNLYYSYCRSRALGETVSDGLIGLWPGGSPRPSPFEEDRGAGTRAAASSGRWPLLPRADREALMLVGVEELTPAEAAGVCGLTAEAFRQRLSRARAALEGELGDSPATGWPAGSRGRTTRRPDHTKAQEVTP